MSEMWSSSDNIQTLPRPAKSAVTLQVTPEPPLSEKRLEDQTVKELRSLAAQLHIRGRSKLMHKEELIRVIRRCR